MYAAMCHFIWTYASFLFFNSLAGSFVLYGFNTNIVVKTFALA